MSGLSPDPSRPHACRPSCGCPAARRAREEAKIMGMKLYISHGADPNDWFIVEPRPGETRTSIVGTPVTSEMAVASLVSAGRTVYEIDVAPKAHDVIRLVPERKITMPDMTLLATYKDGPRIWDANFMVPQVLALAGAGLIKPVPGSGAYTLTAQGRDALREAATIDLDRQVTVRVLIEIARQLGPNASGIPVPGDPSDNPEYYRALTELICDAGATSASDSDQRREYVTALLTEGG